MPNLIEKFKALPNDSKVIFLPHCLRSPDCRAKNTDSGIVCEECGRCSICSFKKEAEKKGISVFIVPGASLVMKIIEKNKVRGVVGVACAPELEQAFKQWDILIRERKIIPVTVQLLRDGCVNTDVEWDRLYELIR